MSEKENFIRIVKEIYNNIKPVDYSNKTTEIEKTKEFQRWNNDFIKQTQQIEKMLNDHIFILGLIPETDKIEIENIIKEISTEYLS